MPEPATDRPHGEATSTIEATSSVAAEDGLRAGIYRVLAAFLSRPADRRALDTGAQLIGDDTELGRAIDAFADACRAANPADVADEYQNLFIGLTRGEVLPYGSYYLTGFLHEKPLARLRQDMALLGIERDPSSSEPEDHIASLLDMMAGLIDGSFGEPLLPAEQKRFFETHIGSWVRIMFRDLEEAESAELYAAVGTVGRTFMEVELEAFRMV